MPLKNIATVERMALTTMTSPCSSCYSRLKFAAHEAAADPGKARLADTPRHRYRGTVHVQHLLDTFMERAGVEGIAKRVQRPLAGLKVACYYGCLITRPSRITGAEHHEYPTRMDELVGALGAEPVSWSSKTDCCGGSLGLTQTEAALKLTGRVLANAKACGADVVASMCPLCQMNLDARQTRLPGEPIPVLHATQLMLLAFGEDGRSALLDKALVDSRPLLRARKLLPPEVSKPLYSEKKL
jgi:heterodisulfide reductase subunit B